MSTLYTTRATAIGGRSGSVSTDDGLFSAQLALPASMGGNGNATNPEQLFAAGYAACFGNAVMHIARSQKIALKDADVSVTAEVAIGTNDKGGFQLGVALTVALAGVERAVAEQLTAAAHQVCPYSNAVRGNIDVRLSVQG